MKKAFLKVNKAIRFSFVIIMFLSLIAGACTESRSKIDTKNLIPAKDLVAILTDMHITDGLLTLPAINYWASSLDSITTYMQVIEKHGYTKDALDKTMRYYFVNDPKGLNKIYDQVLGILSEMESRVDKQDLAERTRSLNLWPGKEFYSFNDQEPADSARFDITLSRAGIYTLSFTVTLFPDDQSIKPRPSAYSCSPDSIETGKRLYTKSFPFLKDGRPHKYHLIINVPEKSLHVRGWLINIENNKASLEKHARFENISLGFTSNVTI